MESPFTDYLPQAVPERNLYQPVSEFDLEGPFVEHVETATENLLLEDHLSLYETTTAVDWPRAVRLNEKYGMELGWTAQLPQVIEVLLKGTGQVNKNLSGRSLAEAVYAWQRRNGLSGASADGIIGPNTWKKLQPLVTAQAAQPAPVAVPVQPLSRWNQLIPGTKPSPAIPLVHGRETFRRMVDAIRTANGPSHFIYITGWMLDIDFPLITGDQSTKLFTLLHTASQKGVEIRVLIWENIFYTNTIATAESKINQLSNALLVRDHSTFGSLAVQNAIQKVRNIAAGLPTVLQQVQAWKDFLTKINLVKNEGSHHEKIVVVKGTEGLIGFCGGIDINKNRIEGVNGLGQSEVLHDVHCEVRDGAAWKLMKRFIQRWNVCKITQPNPFQLRQYLPLKGETEPEPQGTSSQRNLAHVKIIHTYNHPSSGSVKERSIRETVRVAIANARTSVHIEDQYMISLEIATWLNKKLREPSFRSVTILTQDDRFAKDDIFFPKAMRARFRKVLEDGLNAYQKAKIGIYMLHPDSPPLAHHKVHSKLYIIDNELAIVGSANLSSRSMTHDTETAAVIFNDPGTQLGFVDRMNALLNSDPLAKKISYAPNSKILDWDVQVFLAMRTFAMITITNPILTPVNLLLNQAMIILMQMRPFVIDVVDPDADGTIPQQELPDTLQEVSDVELSDEVELTAPLAISQTEADFHTEHFVSEDQFISSFFKKAFPATSFLPAAKNTKALASNKTNVQKSGLSIAAIYASLAKTVDVDAVRKSLLSGQGNGYVIDSSAATVDSVFTEAVHQFQKSHYIDPRQHDGILGRSTLETLGFFQHGLKSKPAGSSYYGQGQLNRKDVKDEVTRLTNGTYTASNWYEHILKPAWLGVAVTDGVHALLLEKLRQAEAWLLNQPAYKGMTPAAMGAALGFTATTRYSGARLSAEKQAMHGFGLAIDIHVAGNPWIGAGWVKNDETLLKERYRMIDALRAASGNPNLPGKTVFAYLDSIAQTSGADTAQAYRILKQRNDEFVSYLRRNATELAYWKSSQSFVKRDPLNGFLNMHHDLVYALRQVAGLAWGAIDFGPRASGDIMHFDMRTTGVGKFLCDKIGGYVPSSGHPVLQKEATDDESFQYHSVEDSFQNDFELHEAIEEGLWTDEEVPQEFVFEHTEAHDHEDYEDNSSYEDIHYETEELVKNWSNAVSLNRKYGSSLGWDQYYTQINELVLPYSGLENVSLGEEAFAQAVAGWQQQQGFSEKDADGVIGPKTWSIMKSVIQQGSTPVVTIGTPSGIPSLHDIPAFNQWHAQRILDSMESGLIGENFHSRTQLAHLSRGEQVLNVNPRTRIIQVLPIMYHIAEGARQSNDRDIIFGSFIRGTDKTTGKCTGHCVGRCIDINYRGGDFTTEGAAEMVVRILRYLTSLSAQYRKNIGFGMPLQGRFFGGRPLNKFKSVSPSLLYHTELQSLVTQLGFVFPDNPNHLHIQVNWMG